MKLQVEARSANRATKHIPHEIHMDNAFNAKVHINKVCR